MLSGAPGVGYPAVQPGQDGLEGIGLLQVALEGEGEGGRAVGVEGGARLGALLQLQLQLFRQQWGGCVKEPDHVTAPQHC